MKNDMKEALDAVLKEKPTLIIFDTETTGYDSKKNKILQISAIKLAVGESGKYEEIDRLDEYIRPVGKIPQRITELTKITNEFIKTKPYEEYIFPVIQSFFEEGDIYIGQNVSFDIRFMMQLYLRNDDVFPQRPVIDTYRLAQALIAGNLIPDHKLHTLVKFLSIDDSGISYHSAIGDVIMTQRVFIALFKQYVKGTPFHEPLLLSSTAPAEKKEKEPINFVVDNMSYWKYQFSERKGLRRIYIRLHAKDNSFFGTVYYDLETSKFYEKDKNMLNNIDVNSLLQECTSILHTLNCSSLEKFKGSYSRS